MAWRELGSGGSMERGIHFPGIFVKILSIVVLILLSLVLKQGVRYVGAMNQGGGGGWRPGEEDAHSLFVILGQEVRYVGIVN